MQLVSSKPQLPLYSLEPDETGNADFSVYNFEGALPDQADLLIPHRKDHYRLVLEARRLLFHTNNSLKEIAFDLGISDASYFNRFFKRETSSTPSECRSTFRKMYH